MRKLSITKNDKGQSLVETALVLPIIILMLTAVIDFGILFNNYLVINNASREGARSAALGSNDSTINGLIGSMISGTMIQSSKLTVTISPSSRISGGEVSITLQYKNNLFTPVLSSVVPNPLTIKAKSVMRVE